MLITHTGFVRRALDILHQLLACHNLYTYNVSSMDASDRSDSIRSSSRLQILAMPKCSSILCGKIPLTLPESAYHLLYFEVFNGEFLRVLGGCPSAHLLLVGPARNRGSHGRGSSPLTYHLFAFVFHLAYSSHFNTAVSVFAGLALLALTRFVRYLCYQLFRRG